MSFVPSDVEFGGIYWPPLVLSFFIGLALMVLTAYFLNRTSLSRFFMFPLVVMTAITAIYTVVLGTFVFPT